MHTGLKAKYALSEKKPQTTHTDFYFVACMFLKRGTLDDLPTKLEFWPGFYTGTMYLGDGGGGNQCWMT